MDDGRDYKVMDMLGREELDVCHITISSLFTCVCITTLTSTIVTRFRTHSLNTHLLDAGHLHLKKYQRIRKYPNHVTEVVNSEKNGVPAVIRKSIIEN